MEKRKVQVTGGSSYIVTLPKEWIKKRGIKKNDVLNLMSQPDGSLLISDESQNERDRKTIEIDVEKIDRTNLLFRMLVGAYIKGYTSIVVSSASPLTASLREIVRKFVKNTVGLEIIEEDEKKIEISDLLSPLEMPFNRTIKRMYMLVKNMHKDAVFGLSNGDKKILAEIIERDTEIDRLYWLIAHQYNSVCYSGKPSSKIDISPESGVYYFINAKTIERIGDHAVRMSQNAMKILDSDVGEDIMNGIKRASEMSLEIFTRSIDSWLRGDIFMANENIESIEELIGYCDEISDGIIKKSGITAIALGNIIESIRRTGEYSTDISEMAINYLIR